MSTNPTAPFTNESNADDRVECLRNDASQHQARPAGGQTYLSKAVAEAGAELGRWRHLTEQTIVGARGPQPTSYAQMAREREQQLVLDASQDGHAALALEKQRGRIPIYPQLPSGPWAAPDPSGDELPLNIDVNAVKDVSKVNP
jgi:hypothetical protein